MPKNIPNNELRELIAEYNHVRKHIQVSIIYAEILHDKIQDLAGLGRSDLVTVYKVPRTKVRGFTRKAYTAMRIKKG